jgi:hypothetical protein
VPIILLTLLIRMEDYGIIILTQGKLLKAYLEEEKEY